MFNVCFEAALPDPSVNLTPLFMLWVFHLALSASARF